MSSAVGICNASFSLLGLDEFDADPNSLGPERDGCESREDTSVVLWASSLSWKVPCFTSGMAHWRSPVSWMRLADEEGTERVSGARPRVCHKGMGLEPPRPTKLEPPHPPRSWLQPRVGAGMWLEGEGHDTQPKGPPPPLDLGGDAGVGFTAASCLS